MSNRVGRDVTRVEAYGTGTEEKGIELRVKGSGSESVFSDPDGYVTFELSGTGSVII
jgi:hypothetical protein